MRLYVGAPCHAIISWGCSDSPEMAIAIVLTLQEWYIATLLLLWTIHAILL